MKRIAPVPLLYSHKAFCGGGASLRSAPATARRCSSELPTPVGGGGGEPRWPISWRGGGAAQGGTETKYGLNALARWVAPGSAHPPLFQIPGPRPARRGRQDGGRSFLLRSAPQQHLRPAARAHLEPSASGERPQKRIPPQGCGSGAPGAPANFSRGEPERSA
ncbi:hypothetical protein NDU88_005035 [Pleurodeles waltl]|uniref:Uncharacterized protein n=1 Tax=Pleurodeles waltl TaxID=8319 RepID=A0AAV7RJ17_PLEWA|nr:hypothetical protein NDU88_005035 [Pleurodeles waltl]